MEQKQIFKKELENLLNDQSNGVYIGGTLIVMGPDNNPAYLNVDGRASFHGQRYLLSKAEQLLVAKLYIKHKTPGHAFYKEAEKIIKNNACDGA